MLQRDLELAVHDRKPLFHDGRASGDENLCEGRRRCIAGLSAMRDTIVPDSDNTAGSGHVLLLPDDPVHNGRRRIPARGRHSALCGSKRLYHRHHLQVSPRHTGEGKDPVPDVCGRFVGTDQRRHQFCAHTASRDHRSRSCDPGVVPHLPGNHPDCRSKNFQVAVSLPVIVQNNGGGSRPYLRNIGAAAAPQRPGIPVPVADLFSHAVCPAAVRLSTRCAPRSSIFSGTSSKAGAKEAV